MKLTGAEIVCETLTHLGVQACVRLSRRRDSAGLRRAARIPSCTTFWCGTSRARRTWPTAMRAPAAESALRWPPRGPGATNMVTGIATAMLDSSPIVCITGQVSSKLLGSDAFQEIDITGITMPITKHNCRGDSRAEDIARNDSRSIRDRRVRPPGSGAGRHHQRRAASVVRIRLRRRQRRNCRPSASA